MTTENIVTVGALARFEAKQGRGQVKISKLAVTQTYLEEMLMDLWLCRMAITDAQRKVSLLRRFARDLGEHIPLVDRIAVGSHQVSTRRDEVLSQNFVLVVANLDGGLPLLIR